ncbi:MAG: GlsB/YeaQ/YmgE family stress response membrane protein [Austwickia sp.]|nr:GlsB/YeaQ/YmgE family stress response membrane protein [Austwickia sp.]MBK8435961.1 GlsB/YeaQ/YmgE family stress response membrane protein [Austwickia sp.]MBK9101644.1 GlsB/YeaQ/YmgE family stress response membrane protein [Austwickia sp.]
MWTIISTIVVGLIIGALARLVLPGRQNISIVMTILLGVIGAFLGSWIPVQFFGYGNSSGGIAWIPLIIGVAVAALLIVAYGSMTGRSNTGTGVR